MKTIKSPVIGLALFFLFTINAFGYLGEPDISFGTNGKVMFHHSGITPSALARQSDGKIIAVGSYSNPSVTLVIRRYNANGTIDTTFGSSGMAVPYMATGAAILVAIQADGKIVVAGRLPGPGYSSVAVWRFNANGFHDSGFGTNGRSVVGTTSINQLDLSVFKTSSSAAIPESILVGYGGNTIKRLNSNGSINTSFGQSGALTGVGEAFVTRNATIFQSASIVTAHLYSGLVILRGYNAAGQVDTSFAGSGMTASYYGTPHQPVRIDRVTRTGLGKLLVQGTACEEGFQGCLSMPPFIGSHSANGALENTNVGEDYMLFPIRSNLDGSLLTTKGPNPGRFVKLASNLVTVEESVGAICHDLVIQPDTKFVCATAGYLKRFNQ